MVYEAEIPPVPDRNKELEMISKLEDNFIKHPYSKLIQNEHLRLNKVELKDQISNYHSNLLKNISLSMVLLGFASIPFINLYRTNSTGVPQYFLPKVYYVSYSENFIHFYRNLKTLRLVVPSIFISSVLLGVRYTDRTNFLDENYETRKAKLPFDN